MRVETTTAWIFVGFGLLMIGTLLYMFEVNGQLARFLGVVGLLHFGIGVVLSVVYDRHMIADASGRERE